MLYDISINPPILSMLTIIFMVCMEALLAIYGDSDLEKLKEATDTTQRIILLISITLKALVFFFLLLNIVILYSKL